MENLRHFLFAAAVLFALSSCADKNVTVVKSFPEEGELALLKKVPYDPTEYNIGWYSTSNGFYIYRLWDEPFFALLDKDRNEIVRFGKKGNGPGEFLSPDVIKAALGRGDTLELFIRDWARGCLYRTSVNTKDGGYRTVLEKDFGKRMRELHILGDGRYLCSAENNRYYFLEADGSEHYLEGWGEDVDEVLENSDYYVPVFQSMGVISPDSSLFAINSISFPTLIVHDLQGNRLKTMHIGEVPENMDMPSRIGSFLNLDYIGDKLAVIYETYDEDWDVSECFLCIFDRNLNPLKRYPLPDGGNTLNIDRTTGIATVLSYDNEAFYEYDLSEWLN